MATVRLGLLASWLAGALCCAPVVLLDNGSLRAAAALALRATASSLARQLGRDVAPASLRFSDSIGAEELGGEGAWLLRDALRAYEARGMSRAVVVPLFLGPSASLEKGVDACLTELRAEGLGLEVHLGRCLVDLEEQASDDRVACALAALVEEVAEARGISTPLRVIVVDHGTPSPKVNAVREHLAAGVRSALGERASEVAAASMERREGAKYDFNEPLLEGLLQQTPFNKGDVILAMAFLLPGRHAGEGGDIAQIIQHSEKNSPGLRVHPTPLLAAQPLIHKVLRERALAAEMMPVLQTGTQATSNL
ncbi:MAG: hypothetical protein SGPRY_010194 [Prymnesium sp.]